MFIYESMNCLVHKPWDGIWLFLDKYVNIWQNKCDIDKMDVILFGMEAASFFLAYTKNGRGGKNRLSTH